MEQKLPDIDAELYAMIDDEKDREYEELTEDELYEQAREQVWGMIGEIETGLSFCRDPDGEDEAIGELSHFLLKSVVETTPDQNMTPGEQYNLAIQLAEEQWQVEEGIVRLLTGHVFDQLQSAATSRPASLSKKVFMAEMMAEGNLTDGLYELADKVLDGPALNTKRYDDGVLVKKAIKAYEVREQSPEVQLTEQLLQGFDVPTDYNSPEGDYSDEQRIDYLQRTDLAKDLAMITVHKDQPTDTPNRHQAIHELFREYDISNLDVIDTVIKATDAFVLKSNKR